MSNLAHKLDEEEPLPTIHYGQDVLLMDKQARDHLLIAGVGYGKTHFGPKWLEKRRTENENSKQFIIVAPTYKLLREVCFEDYRQHLFSVGYNEGKDYKYNRSHMTFTFGPQKILGFSGEVPESIVGFTSAFAWLDEAALMVEQVRKNVIKRNRCPFAQHRRQRLYTTTPEGLNWLYEHFGPDKLTRDGVISRNKNKLVLHGSSLDNPYLDDEYRNDLELEFAWDPLYYANYVLGEFVNLARNAFYFAFDPLQHVKPVELNKDLKRMILTWDSNVGQMTWLVLQSFVNRWHVVAENGSNGRNIEDACNQFKERFNPREYQDWEITVLGDASLHARSPHSHQKGYEMISSFLKPYYPGLVIKAHIQNPLVEERSRRTNSLFHSKRLFVNPACTKLVKSLREAQGDGKGGIKKPSKDTVTHAAEALDMALVDLEPLQLRQIGGAAY